MHQRPNQSFNTDAPQAALRAGRGAAGAVDDELSDRREQSLVHPGPDQGPVSRQIGREHVIAHNRTGLVEPVRRNARQHASFAGNRVEKHNIECTQAIRGYNQQ